MPQRFDIYRCECGELFEALRGTEIDPQQCCGKSLTRLSENTTDGAKEKHVPVMENSAKGILVKVGSVPHPMVPEHFIEWIEVICEHGVMRRHLTPNDKPEAEFPVCGCKTVKLREYCNIHGLWAAPGK